MKGTKRGAPGAAGVASRVATVKKAVASSVDCSDRVKQMLLHTLSCTVGTPEADRHPFNARFVAMIEQILAAEFTRLNQDVASKEAAFAELSPAKATREAALEEKKGVTAEKAEALKAAKEAVAGIAETVKESAAALSAAKKSQSLGDQEVDGISASKAEVLKIQEESLRPLLAGTSAGDEKAAQVKTVLAVGKVRSTLEFDPSLMNTAAEVLKRDAAERGGFDATCLEQLTAAFTTALAKLDEEIAVHAPGKAERAAAVEAAEAANKAALESQADLKEKLAAAKDAKAAADAEQKEAAKSLQDFMPELKTCGDSLDAAKKKVKEFGEVSQTAFTELKTFKEGDFVVKSYYQQIDGMKCDRQVIETCQASLAADGRVNEEDAKKVFATIADGNKETRNERWTLRYCLQSFKWTEAAHDWIVTELKKVPQEDAPAKKARTSGKGYYETIDGYKCDRAMIDICRQAVASEVEGEVKRVSAEDAQKVWVKAADGRKVTAAEKWTLRYCLSAFGWSREGHDYIVEQLSALDAK